MGENLLRVNRPLKIFIWTKLDVFHNTPILDYFSNLEGAALFQPSTRKQKV